MSFQSHVVFLVSFQPLSLFSFSLLNIFKTVVSSKSNSWTSSGIVSVDLLFPLNRPYFHISLDVFDFSC